MQVIQERRRLILLVLVVLVLLCLVVALAINLFYGGGGDDVAEGDTPTPTLTPTEEGPIVIVTPEEEQTPTPTRVVIEEPTEEPPTEPTVEPTTEPTATPATAPTVKATLASTDADFTATTSTTAGLQTGNLLENGGFEQGFDDLGVGLSWQHFKTDGASVSFSSETFDSLIKEGNNAQRISIENALMPDRYAGIYQTVEVVSNQPYTFTIYGQTRSFFGDIEQSGYGYRVQYAVDPEGGTNWQNIPQTEWVELPWDEQKLDAPNPELVQYTTQIIPTTDKITLFVRVWNKWPDPKLVEYTFDSLSLVGPVPGMALTGTSDEEGMIDRPLPVTGRGDLISFMHDGRFWGAVLVLILLAIGAVYRARWNW